MSPHSAEFGASSRLIPRGLLSNVYHTFSKTTSSKITFFSKLYKFGISVILHAHVFTGCGEITNNQWPREV